MEVRYPDFMREEIYQKDYLIVYRVSEWKETIIAIRRVPQKCPYYKPFYSTHEYLMLHGKKGFVDLVKIIKLGMGRLAWTNGVYST